MAGWPVCRWQAASRKRPFGWSEGPGRLGAAILPALTHPLSRGVLHSARPAALGCRRIGGGRCMGQSRSCAPPWSATGDLPVNICVAPLASGRQVMISRTKWLARVARHGLQHRQRQKVPSRPGVPHAARAAR
jgi:hypothetical protein